MAKTLLSTILHLLYVIQHITHNVYKNRGQISSCVVSQLCMLSIPGPIPAAHTIVGTGGTVL